MTASTKKPGRPTQKKPASKPSAARHADKVAKPASERPQPAKPAASPPPAAEVAELTAADLTSVGEDPIQEAEQDAEQAEKTSERIEPLASVQAEVNAMAEIQEKIEQKGTDYMVDVVETTKKYTDEAKERFQSAFAEISERAKSNVEKSSKAIEELSDIAKGNVEAIVESGKIASKGMESIGQEAAEYGRVTFEKASAAMKSLAAVKSPAEFFQVQSELLSSSFDSFAKETAKNSEAFLKLAGDVVQPISTRVSVVTDKVRSLAA